MDHTKAEQIIRDAFAMAENNCFSEEWIPLIAEIWDFDAKTYVAALGAVILAKAVDSDIDVFSIKKVKHNPKSFSLRNLGHNVLVPISRELGFSIKTTGREPLNNQPFFRYNNVSEIERSRNIENLNRYKEILKTNLAPLDSHQSKLALAAFIKIGLAEFNNNQIITEVSSSISMREIQDGINILLNETTAGPWIVQALGAAFVSCFYENLKTRRLNDPSRNFPGDIQAYNPQNDAVLLSLEARNKKVLASDAESFAESCFRSGIQDAIILEITGNPTSLNKFVTPIEIWEKYQVALLIIDSITEMLSIASSLGLHRGADSFKNFTDNFTRYLMQIEPPSGTLSKWDEYINSIS